jgi:hypothetical protein
VSVYTDVFERAQVFPLLLCVGQITHMLNRCPAAARLGRLCQHHGGLNSNYYSNPRAVSSTRGSVASSTATSAAAAAEPGAAGPSKTGMDADLEQLIRNIHASPYKATIYVTGGCAQVCCTQTGWQGNAADTVHAMHGYRHPGTS